jgi:hypothetical protein
MPSRAPPLLKLAEGLFSMAPADPPLPPGGLPTSPQTPGWGAAFPHPSRQRRLWEAAAPQPGGTGDGSPFKRERGESGGLQL